MINAMKQALGVLEADEIYVMLMGANGNNQRNAASALRQAIEQAEKQEPVAWVRDLTSPQPHCVTFLKYLSIADTDAGVKYIPVYTAPKPEQWNPSDMAHRSGGFSVEQEPVAWVYVNEDGECEQIEYGTDGCDDPDVQPLYTAPPKRPWVGLTEDEISNCWINFVVSGTFTKRNVYEAIEAKLKERNGL